MIEPSLPLTLTSGPFEGLSMNGYGAVLADPAWTFTTRSGKGKDRSPEQHYECMTIEEIKALPVADLAARDCALFLWTIDTHLPQALDVITAWGFTYKTVAFTWAKTQDGTLAASDDRAWFKGMGFWTRANPETCLLATKGSPGRLDAAVRRLMVEPRREHSRKPDETYARIERLVGGPYVELFSRTSRAGWDAWGHEVGRFTSLSTLDVEIESLL